jgi:hypothetical protein
MHICEKLSCLSCHSQLIWLLSSKGTKHTLGCYEMLRVEAKVYFFSRLSLAFQGSACYVVMRLGLFGI